MKANYETMDTRKMLTEYAKAVSDTVKAKKGLISKSKVSCEKKEQELLNALTARIDNMEGLNAKAMYKVQYMLRMDEGTNKWTNSLKWYDIELVAEHEAERLVAQGKREDERQRCDTINVGGGFGAEMHYEPKFVVTKARVIRRYCTTCEVVKEIERD